MSDLFHRIHGAAAVAELVDRSDEDVLVALAGRPALLCVPGTAPAPRRGMLVVCLLHGNEDSGYRAALELLRARRQHTRDLWVFIGNVRAASQEGWYAHRYLDDQEDFNRVWGLEPLTTRMRRCAAEVLEVLRTEANLDFALDLHNNTGANPFYSVVPGTDPAALRLAGLCADTALRWPLQAHTLMQALEGTCPAIAVECGLPGLPEHTAYAGKVLDRALGEVDLADGPLPRTVYTITHKIEVRPEVAFTVGGVLSDTVDLVLSPGLDARNFAATDAGTEIGVVPPGAAVPFCVTAPDGTDVTDEVLTVDADGSVRLAIAATPVMLTLRPVQIRRDCLTYLARRDV